MWLRFMEAVCIAMIKINSQQQHKQIQLVQCWSLLIDHLFYVVSADPCWSFILCCCWFSPANNSCHNAPCTHVCLPKTEYPQFTCVCPDDDQRVRYSLDSLGFGCLLTRLVPGKLFFIGVSHLFWIYLFVCHWNSWILCIFKGQLQLYKFVPNCQCQ